MKNGRLRPIMLTVWLLAASSLLLSFLLGIPPAFRAMTTLSGESPLVDLTQTAIASLQISPLAYALYALLMRTITVAVHLVLAALLVRSRQRGWFIWFLALYMLIIGATFTQDVVALGLTSVFPFSLSTTTYVVNNAGWLLFISFLFLFPNGRFVPRWTVLALIGWYISYLLSAPALPIQVSFILIGVGSQIYRYRRVSTVAERRQTKWVVFGLLLFVVGSIALLPAINREESALAFEVVTGLALLLPLSIGVAILRGQLWDVDVIIRKTVQYGVITAVLALVYFGSVILLQTVVGRAAGDQSPIILVLSTLLIAALFNPLRQRVQQAVDRRFFRQKYDAQRVLAQFAQTARDEVSLEALKAELHHVIQETMQPEAASIWLK